jgi:hypothetical protein
MPRIISSTSLTQMLGLVKWRAFEKCGEQAPCGHGRPGIPVTQPSGLDPELPFSLYPWPCLYFV